MGTFGRMWQDLYWIDLLSLLAVRRHRPWDRIDVVWFLLRLSCKPVVATEVLVLGGSVTGGGGVGNDPSRAWHSMLNDVKPTVHYKGAIDPSYFLHCTRRFVEHEYDAVLLDLGANMFTATSVGSLVALIQRVRCLHHISAVAVVDWPGVVPRINDTRTAARRAGATLIEVPHGRDLYSADRVHPNALGHARIAERVRAYLAGPLNDWLAPEQCAPIESEECYPQAPDMPVVMTPPPRGWKLVDESPTPERAHKYGWSASTDGATLSLVVPKQATCGAIVTLAYLSSNYTGSFLLSCAKGCACSKIRMYHQWRSFPFPVVTGREEWMGVCSDCARLKITRETAFNLLREGDAPCRVSVTTMTDKRVRIDGMYVQEPSEAYLNGNTLRAPRPTEAQRQFEKNALKTGGACHANSSTG